MNIKRLMLRSFLAVFPKKYLPQLIFRLTQASHVRCGYSEFDIFLEQGIATDPAGVEPELVEWIRTYLKPGQVFYDVGANVGAYSLLAAKCHRGTVKVFAFEPAAPTAAMLMNNIIYNGCSQTVSSMSFPLARKPTLAPFNYHRSVRPGGAMHAFGEAVHYGAEAFQPVFQEYMVSTTLDQLVNEFKLPAPNHIKIDVDGLESEILAGGEAVLRSGAVESIFFEVGAKLDLEGIRLFLSGCGFSAAGAFKHDNTSNLIFVKNK